VPCHGSGGHDRTSHHLDLVFDDLQVWSPLLQVWSPFLARVPSELVNPGPGAVVFALGMVDMGHVQSNQQHHCTHDPPQETSLKHLTNTGESSDDSLHAKALTFLNHRADNSFMSSPDDS
jgi:hypothetical protein